MLAGCKTPISNQLPDVDVHIDFAVDVVINVLMDVDVHKNLMVMQLLP